MICFMNFKEVNAYIFYDSSDVLTKSLSDEKENNKTDIDSIFEGTFSAGDEKVNLCNILSVPYLEAQRNNDTLIVVLENERLKQWLPLDSICMPQTEEQIKIDSKHSWIYRSVEDMEHNTDGDYDVPYLFVMNNKDTLQYIITFPINKPYTYELCTARFANDSQNNIARTIFQTVQSLGVNTIIEDMDYNYIWLVVTDWAYVSYRKKREYSWSILLKINRHIAEWCLFTNYIDTIVTPECIWSWYDLSSIKQK